MDNVCPARTDPNLSFCVEIPHSITYWRKTIHIFDIILIVMNINDSMVVPVIPLGLLLATTYLKVIVSVLLIYPVVDLLVCAWRVLPSE